MTWPFHRLVLLNSSSHQSTVINKREITLEIVTPLTHIDDGLRTDPAAIRKIQISIEVVVISTPLTHIDDILRTDPAAIRKIQSSIDDFSSWWDKG